jgi:hypothetical protein
VKISRDEAACPRVGNIDAADAHHDFVLRMAQCRDEPTSNESARPKNEDPHRAPITTQKTGGDFGRLRMPAKVRRWVLPSADGRSGTIHACERSSHEEASVMPQIDCK